MAMPYETYDTADFLLDDPFVDWVQTGHNDKGWQDFLAQFPHKQAVIEQARTMILAASQTPGHFPNEQQVGQMWGVIRQAVETGPVQTVRPLRSTRNVPWYWAAAASILIVAGWWVWLRQPTGQSTPGSYQQLVAESLTPLRETVNQTSKPIPLAMPDGTTVILKPGSRLSYPATFDKQAPREVFLSGEAFFDVVKNPRQPFVVRAKTLTATVLGTSFTVSVREQDKRSFVLVRTGKVSVRTSTNGHQPDHQGVNEPKAVVLTPNQQLTFDQSGERLTPVIAEHTNTVQPVTETVSLDFDEVPLPTVFERLEKLHNVDLVYDENVLKDCRLSASLSDEPLFVKLRLICKTMGARYQVINNQIVIQSTGCNQ